MNNMLVTGIILTMIILIVLCFVNNKSIKEALTTSTPPTKIIPSKTTILTSVTGRKKIGCFSITFFNQNNKKIGGYSILQNNPSTARADKTTIKSYETVTPDILSSYTIQCYCKASPPDIYSVQINLNFEGTLLTSNNDTRLCRNYKILEPYTLPLATSPKPPPTPDKPIPHPDKPVPSIFNRAYLRVTNKVKSNYKQGQQLPKSKCGYDYNGGEPFTNISEQCNKGTNTNLINNGGYFCGTGWGSVPKCEYATEAGYTVPEAITAPGKCKSYPKTPSNPSDQNWPNFSDGGADSNDPHVCYDIKTQNCWKPNMNQLPRYPVCPTGDILVNNPTPKHVPTHKPILPGVPTPKLVPTHKPILPGVPTPKLVPTHKPILPGVPTPKLVPTHKPILPGVPTPKHVPTHKPILPGVPTPKHVPTHKPILPGVPTPHTVISTRVVPKPGTRDIPDDKDLVTLADQHITSMQQGTGSRTVPSSYFKDYCPI